MSNDLFIAHSLAVNYLWHLYLKCKDEGPKDLAEKAEALWIQACELINHEEAKEGGAA